MPEFADTDARLDDVLATLAPGTSRLVAQHYALERHWLMPADTQSVHVTYLARRGGDGLTLSAALGAVDNEAAMAAMPRVRLDAPVRLQPVEIAKPWGRELWYTGVEARGESSVVGDGGTLALSVYLSMAPYRTCANQMPTLLKILDPRPEAVLGDLYFEVHETKQEVYVVTHVDRSAWPDGVGRIRFGMNPEVRARYGDDAAFRRAYLAAVQRYEATRRALDDGDGALPSAEQEVAERRAMDEFTNLAPLRIGDVVRVPVRLPHSLQHGVRVVEFQTPTYERQILSFAQRTVTQTGWDTAAAIDSIRLDIPDLANLEPVRAGVERLVEFDDFGAWRIRLDPGDSFVFPDHLPYAVIMGLAGSTTAGQLNLGGEQAAFVPGSAIRGLDGIPATSVSNAADATATFLIAAPGL